MQGIFFNHLLIYLLKKYLSIFIIIIACSYNAYSWSKDGHQIVAEVAKHYLKKSVVDSVQKYLDTLSFGEAANWMDNLRSKPEFDYLKPWHYVNIPKDNTYVVTDKPNIINQLQFAIDNLKSKNKLTRDEISFNLKVIFHLVGDIHQPLHCGYFDDKGGNTVELNCLNHKDNLHHVWDKSMIESLKITTDTCLKYSNKLSRKIKKKIQKTPILSWVEESRVLLPAVYNFTNASIDENYMNQNKPLLIKQLSCAGLRLSYILNTVFDK